MEGVVLTLLKIVETMFPENKPKATAEKRSTNGGSGDVWKRANDVPIADIVSWLGLEVNGAHVQCPGCGEKDARIPPSANGIKCYHNRCQTEGRDGYRSVIDVVCAHQHIKPVEALRQIGLRFGFDVPTATRSRDLDRADRHAVATKAEVVKDGTWRDLLLCTYKGAIRKTLGNAETIVLNDPALERLFAFNERSSIPMIMREPPWAGTDFDGGSKTFPRPLADGDLRRTRTYVEREYELDFPANYVDAGILAAVERHRYDPVRDYLDSLVWDGMSRVRMFAEAYLGAPARDEQHAAYLREASVCWLVAAVARTYDPGCKADQAIVLEGPQGLGKSSAVSILASGVPGTWYDSVDLANLQNKDTLLGIQGAWLVELPELTGLARADVRNVKAFLVRQTDTYRAPYAKLKEDHPRRCVCAGTTNDDMYLMDATGGRRFLPVACGNIALDALRKDRDQIWAEAVHLYRGGQKWWFVDAAVEAAAAEQQDERRADGDPWVEILAAWLANPLRPDDIGTEGVSVADILGDALSIEPGRQTRFDQMRVATAMKSLGWVRKRRRIDGANIWRYYLPNQ